jgi:hypothetical protein
VLVSGLVMLLVDLGPCALEHFLSFLSACLAQQPA